MMFEHLLVELMKKLTLLVVILVGVLVALGQTPRTTNESPVKPVVKVIETANAATTTKSTMLTAAALSNTTLRNDLTWTFGGKQQRGWYLYDLLINETIDSHTDTVTDNFAITLARWQKQRGLTSDGVLNEDSLMSFVSQWQSNRLKDRTPATVDQLITAPVADFYDPTRAPELRQVERNTYEAYKQMLAAAAQELKLDPSDQYLKIVSAFRSREYQEELRRKSPNAGSAGLAINSPHFTGRALDLYVGGDPVDTRDANRAIQVNTPAYRWLVHNAERFGFRPYFYEPWHWEYVK